MSGVLGLWTRCEACGAWAVRHTLGPVLLTCRDCGTSWDEPSYVFATLRPRPGTGLVEETDPAPEQPTA